VRRFRLARRSRQAVAAHKKLLHSPVVESSSTRGIVKAAEIESAAALKEESEAYLHAVLADPSQTLGSSAALRIKDRLYWNAIQATAEASRILKEVGVSPKQVPLSILDPALQAVALEEDPYLQRIWVNLLANAADPREIHPVLVSFPTILKDLSLREIRVLDALDRNSTGPLVHQTAASAADGSMRRVQYGMDELADICEPTGRAGSSDLRNFRISIGLLMRQGLLEERTSVAPSLHENGGDASTIRPPITQLYSISALGGAFVVVCRPPRA
jgi:hypothetical protein